MDPFSGRLRDPLTLHKYRYANGDPIQGTDPSGTENMMSLMATISVGANLISASVNYLGGVYHLYRGEKELAAASFAAGNWSLLLAGIAFFTGGMVPPGSAGGLALAGGGVFGAQTLVGGWTLIAGLPGYLMGLYNLLSVGSNFSVPARVTPNGAEPVAGKFNNDAKDAIANFDKMTQTIKGTISPARDAAEKLAKEVPAEKGIPSTLRGPEQHAGGLWHFHLEDLLDWHFWFTGKPSG